MNSLTDETDGSPTLFLFPRWAIFGAVARYIGCVSNGFVVRHYNKHHLTMKELAMHVYDLMENSTAAGAKDVKLTIVDSLKNNDFHFTIEDNGKGMSPEFLARVTDPYTTSRTTRKVGLGLPLIKMNTEKCGGGMKLTSEVGVGTRLEFWFEHNNWDRPPMGDLPGTLVMLLSAHEDIHFVATYRTDESEFVLDTDELKEALDGMSMNDIHIIGYLKEMIAENLKEIHANE